MEKCLKCKDITGMYFERQYKPEQYIYGKLNSKVLIIGLNPYGEIETNNLNETTEDLLNRPSHQYYKNFEKVSPRIYKYLGEDNGVICTELVKCFSKNFPPAKLSKHDLHKFICNCREYLSEQLEVLKPKIIICNGIHVVWHIEQIIPIKEEFETYYIGKKNSYEPFIFRSGFIGKIDKYAKRRLGIEIEKILNKNTLLT
ncbi:MAG: uracil-DNA glycosylase family protein [Bacteroidales bacterium]|jgi:uracil-DNA glycosylase